MSFYGLGKYIASNYEDKRNSKDFLIISKVSVLLLLLIVIFPGCSWKGKTVKSKRGEEIKASSGEEIDLVSLASVQVPGWNESQTMLINLPEDLVRYTKERKDEADFFLTYSFKMLAVKKYKNERSLPMLVEVYEFGNSEDAYGVYSFDTVGDKLNIGQEAVYSHGLLEFWKDRMLVRIFAEEEYQDLKEDVLTFGRQIESKILTIGSKPKLLSLLPVEKLISNSLHYFHENACLNNIYYIPESVALGLSNQTNVVAARYASGKISPPLLVLVEYPDGSSARVAFENFTASYFQEKYVSAGQKINILKMSEGEYNSISLSKNFLMLIFDAEDADVCKNLAAETLANIELYGAKR